MTAQVIFLNTMYEPTPVMRAILFRVQEELVLYRAALEHHSAGLCDYQKWLYRERSHNRIRYGWVLIQGHKDRQEQDASVGA